MAEYIERKALLDELCRDNCERTYDGTCHNCRMTETVADFPTVDVEPVVHGIWEPIIDDFGCLEGWIHPECGRATKEASRYCPNCGARMDLDIADYKQSIYEAVLNKWGKESQTRMMFEEMAELQKELCKEARGEDNADAIAEEIADVKIMLEQMIILHNCKDMVGMQMERKLQRLKERLEGE